MRKVTAALLFAALILPIAAQADTQYTYGANLFTNGSFETSSTGWTAQPSVGNSTSFTYPVAGNNGSKALGITVTAYKSGDIFWQPSNVAVTAGMQYLFSAYSLNSAPVPVIAAYLDSTGKAVSFATLGTVPAGASWQKFTATTTIPTGVTQVRIQHVMHSTGSLAIDDYSLQLIGTTTTGTPPPPPPPTMPIISSFTAAPSSITAGQSSTLSWVTTGATLVTINQGIGAVTGTSKSVSPTATTTYTLSAGNSAGTTTAIVVVTVAPVVVTPPPPPPPPSKPTITSFTATPTKITAGQSSTLAWATTGATLLTIDNGVGVVTGTSKSVSPTATTTYTLSAGNSAGTTTATVTVTVAPVVVTPPPPPPPSNLISNGNLETGSTNAPTGWSNDYWGNLTPQFTYPVAGNGGGKAAQLQVTSYTDGAANWVFDHVTDSTHAQYQFSEDYMATVPTELDIEYLMQDGTYDYEWLQTVPASASWKTLTAQITPPTGAVSFTVLHILAAKGTLTIDNASLTVLNDPFAQGMASFIFDDGLLSQYQNAVPILKTAGLNAGFYIITTEPDSGDTGYMSWTQIKDLQAKGYEVGGHTRTHPFLTTLTPAQLTSEVSGSFSDLVAQGITPKTFVYPFGDVNSTVEAAVKTAGYQAARGSYYGLNGTVTDRYDLYDIRVDSTSNLATLEKYIDQAKADKRWVVFELHDVLASGGDTYSITPAFFQSLVSYVKSSGIQVTTLQQGMSQLSN